MEVDGYRIREKKIALPKDGTIPSFPETVGQEEQQTLLAWISCLWQSVEVVSAGQQRRICCGPMPTGAEAFLGWKRWILSHHFFIPLLALVGHALSTATKSMQAGKREDGRKSLEWPHGCGAAVVHCSCTASTFSPVLRSIAVTSAAKCRRHSAAMRSVNVRTDLSLRSKVSMPNFPRATAIFS